MLGLLLVLAAAAPAAAQPSPRDPTLIETARLQRAYDHPQPVAPETGEGVTLSFGWTAQHGGKPGWVGRFESELLGRMPQGRASGAIFGMMTGFEYWQVTPSEGERDFGFSAPLSLVGGVRVFPFRIVVGGGLDMILVDHVARETGVGFYAPFVVGNLSFDLDGWRLGVDARAERRWQISADDHTQYQLVVNFGRTWAAPDRRPNRPRVARP